MDIVFCYPRNEALKELVNHYYFFTAPDHVITRYYSFPGTQVPVSIHKSAQFDIGSNHTFVRASNDSTPIALIQKNYTTPHYVCLQGAIDKVTISFKPCAFNFFIRRPFGEIITANSQLMTEWDHNPQYQIFLKDFFSTKETEERINILESFLLSAYMPSSRFTVVRKAAELITDISQNLLMDQIAPSLYLSTRTLNRLFHTYMGIAPVTLKKIARFRHSVDVAASPYQKAKLTELCYKSNFYDQPYFSKVYKSLTGINPRLFYESVQRMGDGKLMFQFIEQ